MQFRTDCEASSMDVMLLMTAAIPAMERKRPGSQAFISTQTWRVMKLIVLLLTAAFLNVHARGYSQEVTFSGRDVPLQKVFNAIENQTGYVFFYNTGLLRLARPVTLDVKRKPITEVLKACLEGQPLDFEIENTTVVILKRQEVPVIREGAEALPPVRITGIIIDDATKQPLAGASIVVKETKTRAITDDNGLFEITAEPGSTLLISYIGFDTKTLKVDAAVKGVQTVALTRRISDLKEVNVKVSTGYQTISKERATGSFGTIDKEQLGRPSTNISQRIIGTVAGVQARSLDVDGTPTFEIRGQTSLYGNAKPLVVVDGFPVQGDFSSVNPNDVESITILKDAAAASIWGARAANGVIVIITKGARKGVPFKLELSTFTRVGKKLDLDYVNPLASSAETVDYEKQAFNNWSAQINSGALATNYGKSWSPATVAMSENYLGFISTADRDAILEKLKTQSNKKQIADELLSNPVNQQYNLTLSGSSGRMSNVLSLFYAADQSNFKETGDKQYLVNYRTSYNVLPWLDLNLSGMYQYIKANNNGVALSDIQNISPYELLRNPDGTLTNISQYYWPILQRYVPMNLFPYPDWTYNPITEINNRNITATQANTRVQLGLTFKIIKGLTFDTKVQYELFNTFNRSLYNENTYTVRNTVNTAATWDQATNKITLNLPKGSILNQSRTRAEAYNVRNQVNFNRVFGWKHEINFVAGAEVNNVVTETFGNPTAYGYNDQTLTLGTFPNGPGGTFYPIKNWLGTNETFSYTNSFTYGTERYFSYFGNAAYTYDGKYTVSGSYRTDASNLITDDPAYRYSPFWSVGGGWQLYKEKFLSDITWVDRLNVRLTYGYGGNVDKTTAFRPLIATTATPNVYTNDYTATISSYGNPTLRWEKTGTWNLGADYTLFGGRLFGKVDVYSKHGKDLIAQISIPAVNGTTTQKLNNAEMTNRGIELELGTALRILGNDIAWRGSLNFSYNKNRITRLFVATYAASTLTGGGTAAYVAGKDANTLWRFQYAGIYNTEPMVKGAKDTKYDFGAFTPGDGRDYLLNVGTAVAPYTLGFTSDFKIYDFDVSFIVTGKFGHVFQRKGFNYPPTWTSRVLPNNKLSEVVNGDPMKIVPLPQNLVEPRYYFWDRFHQYLSYLIESASTIRMQEVNVAYTLPRTLSRKAGVSIFQVYAQGNNLFTILWNHAGEDPEYPLGTLKPQPKLTLGLKCEF